MNQGGRTSGLATSACRVAKPGAGRRGCSASSTDCIRSCTGSCPLCSLLVLEPLRWRELRDGGDHRHFEAVLEVTRVTQRLVGPAQQEQIAQAHGQRGAGEEPRLLEAGAV